MNKKAMIFDIDGTLIDSLQKHENAFYQACLEYNCNIDDQLKEKLNSLTSAQKISYLSTKGIIDKISIPWLLERKNELALSMCFDDFKPLMQHIDAMNFINKQLNCKIVLCSNSPRKFVNKFIDNCGFEHTIAFSLSGDDVEFKKPFPEIYQKAMNLLNLSPNDVLIFEDSPEGVLAAKRALCEDVIEINNYLDISPSLIQNLVDKFSIVYYNSKYMVHK